MAEPNIEESNLAHIGSDEDKAARKAAAILEAAWDGAGSSPSVRIWRIENGRTEPGGGPNFGVQPWPEDQYGRFRRGDAYIILGTTTEEEGGEQEIKPKLIKHDVYLWIGAASAREARTVAAYKATELGAFLSGVRGATTVVRHHREAEGRESDGFLACFPNGRIAYLNGGGSSQCRWLRRVEREEFTPRLFRVYKQNKLVQAFEVPCGVEALNRGDAFVLDAGGEVVYARFGETCSPFERAEAAEVAREMAAARGGKCRVEVVDTMGEDSSWFWEGIHDASVEMPEPECIPEEEEYVSIVGDAEERRLGRDTNAIVRSPDEVINAGKESPEQARATFDTPLAPEVTPYRSKRTTTDAGERELGRDEMYLLNTDQWTQKSAANPRGRRDCIGVTATKASRDTRAGLGFHKRIRNCTEQIYVSRVADDSIFASSGLAAGDEVVSIEVPVFALTAAEIDNAVRESEGYVTIVTARQAGKKSKRGRLGLRREADLVVMTSAEKGERSAGDAGVGFRKIGGRILVARIEEDSIFAETGLRLDDEVVAVEVGVNGRTAEEVADLIKGSEGDVTLFVVPRHPSALLMRARESDKKRYHFGDITKSVVAKSKRKVGAWRGSGRGEV